MCRCAIARRKARFVPYGHRSRAFRRRGQAPVAKLEGEAVGESVDRPLPLRNHPLGCLLGVRLRGGRHNEADVAQEPQVEQVCQGGKLGEIAAGRIALEGQRTFVQQLGSMLL